MKFHPKGASSVTANLIPSGTIPGYVQDIFQVTSGTESCPVGFYPAAEFLGVYEPGAASGKPSAGAVAERAAVDALIESLAAPAAEKHHKA